MFQLLRRNLLHNLGIKVVSLLLALAVYAHVYSQQMQTAVLHVPLHVEGIPSGLTWRGHVPQEVRVRVRARGAELLKLRTQPPPAVVKLSQPRPGHLERPVTTADVVLPPESDATVEAMVDPVILSMVIEPLRAATLPVAVHLRGRPADGWVQHGLVRVWPETLTVVGPAGVVEPLDSIPTEEINLDGRSRTVGESVRLVLPEAVRARIERVTVRIPLVAEVSREFGPLRVSLPPEFRSRWAVAPESVRVSLAGPESALQSLRPDDLRPRAIPSVPAGAEEVVPVQVQLPGHARAHLQVVGIEPPTVTLVERPR